MVLTSAAVLYFFFLVLLQSSAGTDTANQRENVQFKAKKCYRGPNEEHDLLHLSIISSLSCLDPISQVQITCFFFIGIYMYMYIYIYIYIHRYMVILLFAKTRRLSMQMEFS